MQFTAPNPQPMLPRLTALLLLAVVLALVVLNGCSPRVYWPQGHGQRAAQPAAPSGATITVLEEGRDYQGWSPAPVKCQQRPFPFHSLTKK